MSGERIRVLIADDHPVVRAGLEGMISGQSDLEIAGEAQDGLEAVELAERLRPEVILMDLRMPRMDGATAIERIKERLPETQILVITTHNGGADILRSVEAGATGYVLKDAPREELFRAIRAAAESRPILAPAAAAHLMHRARRPAGEALSGREVEVLELVAKGTSNREIAERLWISESTVKSHLLRIYDRLEATDRASAVAAAIRRGVLRP